MTIYYILYFSMFLLWILISKYKKIYFVYISTCCLLLMYSLRSDSVGWDTYNYKNIFEKIYSFDMFRSYIEPGWIVLNRVIYKISPDFQIALLVYGLIMLYCYNRMVLRYSKNYFVSFSVFYLCGFYFNSMNQTRQMMAIMLCTISVSYLVDKKLFRAILINFIAILFHSSAFFFLIFFGAAYFVKKIDIHLAIIITVSLIVYLSFADLIIIRLSKYFYTNYFTESALQRHIKSGNMKMAIPYLLLLFLCLLCRKLHPRLIDKANSAIVEYYSLLLSILGCVILLMSLRLSLLQRVSEYFTVYFIILLPNELMRIKSQSNRLVIQLSLMAGGLVMSLIYLRYSESGGGMQVLYHINSFSNKLYNFNNKLSEKRKEYYD